jgi:hypothetical protein
MEARRAAVSGPDLSHLTSGATGWPAERNREHAEPSLEDTTYLAHTAAGVYAEILGERRQLEEKLARLEERVEREGLDALTPQELELYHAGQARSRASTFL